MSCIEQKIFKNAPKFQPQQIQFNVEEIQFSQNIKAHIDIVVPPPTISQKPYTIIFAHGNAECLSETHPWLEDMSKILQCRMISYDYFGYGMTSGTSTELTCKQLALMVYDNVHLRFPDNQIIVWGKSVGSVFAIHTAVHRFVASLVIQSGLSSALHVVCKSPCSPLDSFKNFTQISQVNCNVLIIHGLDDEIVPFYCSLKNFETYKANKYFNDEIVETQTAKTIRKQVGIITHVGIHGAGHNDLDTVYEDVLVDELRIFLGQPFSDITMDSKNIRVIKKGRRTGIIE